MTAGTITLNSWTEAMKRVKKIKSLSKKMKIKISDVEIEQLDDYVVYTTDFRTRKRKEVRIEQIKLSWSYTL